MNIMGIYMGGKVESLGLLSVHKWAQNLRFSELGRNKWGFAGIKKTEMKRCRNQEQGGNNSHLAKIRRGYEILHAKFDLQPAKICFPLVNNSCKTKHHNKE